MLPLKYDNILTNIEEKHIQLLWRRNSLEMGGDDRSLHIFFDGCSPPVARIGGLDESHSELLACLLFSAHSTSLSLASQLSGSQETIGPTEKV